MTMTDDLALIATTAVSHTRIRLLMTADSPRAVEVTTQRIISLIEGAHDEPDITTLTAQAGRRIPIETMHGPAFRAHAMKAARDALERTR